MEETERRLFHGCPNKVDALESYIINNGFDRSLAGQNCGKYISRRRIFKRISFEVFLGRKYGAGVYFSTKAAESHVYTKPNGIEEERTMFVCSVLLGKMKLGQKSMVACPTGYHSTTDGRSIHVVFRDAQVYAQYLVHYICPAHLSERWSKSHTYRFSIPADRFTHSSDYCNTHMLSLETKNKYALCHCSRSNWQSTGTQGSTPSSNVLIEEKVIWQIVWSVLLSVKQQLGCLNGWQCSLVHVDK